MRIVRIRHALLAACVAAILPAVAARAADELSGDAESAPPADRKKEANAAESVDDELFKKLTGGAAAKDDADDNPLERAILGMREAQQRIDERDVSEKTRGVQQQVVKSLEELINRLKRQSRSSSSSGSSSKPQDDAGQADEEPTETESPEDGKTRDDQSAESSDRRRDAEQRKSEPLSRKWMGSKVWGHLPPAVRNKLLNASEGTYLPKYDEELRRYFESLADEGRTAPKRR